MRWLRSAGVAVGAGRGVDVAAKFVLYQLMLELADRGTGVLVISSDLEELIGIWDRILVMSGRPGTIADEIRVPIQRPRDLQRDGRAIRDISLRIWQHLRDEVREGLGIVR